MEENNKELRYVAAHYSEGRLSARKALRRLNIVPAGRSTFLWALPLAAALVAGVLLFNGWRNSWTQYGPADTKSLVALADGSKITLSPGASIRVRRHSAPRRIVLDGLAFFEVARDESRPFEVSMDGGYVKVLGTKFSVDAGTGTVSVKEGKVFFADGPDGEGVVLTKNMKAVMRAGVPRLEEGLRLNADAWVTGMFVYEDAQLCDVLTELGEYFGVPLHVSAEDGQRRLSGRFSADSLEDIISAIEAALEISIE